MKTPARAQLALLIAWLLALAFNVTTAIVRPGGSPDTARYDQIGWNLAQGHGYSASPQAPYLPDVFRAPGYPAFLALVFRVAGHNLSAVRLVQAVLLSGIVPLTFLVARQAFGPATALLSAWLAALYPYFWAYSGSVLSDGLAVLLAMAAMALLGLSLSRPTAWAALGAGAALGLLILFKPAMLLFPVAAAAAYAVRRPTGGKWMGRAALYAAGAALVVCPWTARNWHVTGRVLPVASGGGLMLYGGVVGAAAGYDLNELHRRVALGDWRTLAEQHAEDPGVVLKLDDQLRGEGLRLIVSHPAGYVRHLVVSAGRVWISAWVWRGDRWVLSWPHALLSGGLLLAALAGAVVQRRRLREAVVPLALVLYIALAHAPFATEARQSLPGRPALLIFAAALVAWAVARACGPVGTDSAATDSGAACYTEGTMTSCGTSQAAARLPRRGAEAGRA